MSQYPQQPQEPYQGQPQQYQQGQPQQNYGPQPQFYPQQPMMPMQPQKKKHTGRNVFLGCGGAFVAVIVIILIVVVATNANAPKTSGTVINTTATSGAHRHNPQARHGKLFRPLLAMARRKRPFLPCLVIGRSSIPAPGRTLPEPK
jgi:hypothetical protein